MKTLLDNYKKCLNSLLDKPENYQFNPRFISSDVEINSEHLLTPQPIDFLSCFNTVVEKNSFRLAIDALDQQMTYAQLQKKSLQVAHYLLAKQPRQKGVMIGIYLPSSTNWLVAMLGILYAGYSYVPLDISVPSARLDYIIKDAQLKYILSDKHYSLPQTMQVEYIDVDEMTRENLDNECLQIMPRDADAITYMMYTSGSTGRPKGVLITDQGVINLANAQAVAFGITVGTPVIQFASLGFDASVSEIFTSLLHGGLLCLYPWDKRTDTDYLRGFLQDKVIEVATIPPALLAVMREDGLPILKTLVVAGDVCTQAVMERWAKGRNLLNCYGPTEGTVCASIGQFSRRKHYRDIGKAMDGVKLYVMDSQKNLLPAGMIGELYIGGIGLAKAYWQQQQVTLQSFILHQFSAVQKPQRLYATGDLVKQDKQGYLTYIGRNDNQVNLRGYRIEFKEIERCLEDFAAIKVAAVKVVSEENTECLIAYCVLEVAMTVPHDIRQQLSLNLPSYMVPAQIIYLDKLPLNSSGKIAREKLPKPPNNKTTKLLTNVQDPISQRLIVLWQEILGHNNVQLVGDFFEMGGHSLLAVQLLDKINRTFASQFSMNRLFKNPSISLQTLALKTRQQTGYQAVVSYAQQAAAKPAVFFVHPGVAGAEVYRELALQLKETCNFYGVESYNLSRRKQQPLTSISAMATYYVKKIKVIQKQGPYRLGGWSLGGVIAYEMAQQLIAEGDGVDWLCLLDSYHLTPDTKNKMELFFPKIKQDFILENPIYMDVTREYRHELAELARLEMQAMHAYCPQPYAGRILLVKAQQAQSAELIKDAITRKNYQLLLNDLSRQVYNGWENLSTKIECLNVDANHHELLAQQTIGKLVGFIQSIMAKKTYS
ncbi:MAG: amino acid adenylation domain-containing protein [Gammaproteobacteria bacterium]|nr:amino acid adenylation domain-containing protein [Gammaproteobacteria bacterium]